MRYIWNRMLAYSGGKVQSRFYPGDLVTRTGDREIRSESGRLPELSARLPELSGKVGIYAGIELTMRRTSEHGKLGMRRPGIEIVKTEKKKKKTS